MDCIKGLAESRDNLARHNISDHCMVINKLKDFLNRGAGCGGSISHLIPLLLWLTASRFVR